MKNKSMKGKSTQLRLSFAECRLEYWNCKLRRQRIGQAETARKKILVLLKKSFLAISECFLGAS